ncbi:peptidoglycan editing factor PgeF [Sulfurimonas sp.]|uniref:peptidoglycan editing factor PgeF n=1 Tax=Sulfurimonas sp. TaxID=2022749 RepID=UPI0025E7C52B|nr:peptidoglycan editing factor PgeF [Sulfurimonas sp.]MCK9472658.1 peptidoglycan editing factor PgeF [Sulfurimonas sp.]MDD3505110.1 peptidoglycan editing factor PgeF [Sulfurimonas sp.]
MKFYYSEKLSSFTNLLHAFTTKECGNLAFHVGDDKLSVQKQHELLSKELGYERESLVYMNQIHSDIVHLVTNENFTTPPTCDALVTNKIDTPLMVMVADCSPILFYDNQKRVIAAAHAGRQGAFKNIVKNVIDKMQREFDSNPKDIQVSVGASIRACCYEVGSEIYDEAKALGLAYSIEKKEESFYLNVGAILKKQLLLCGIKAEHIEFCDDCTCCSTNRYFSYRAQAQTGRFAGVIMLRG